MGGNKMKKIFSPKLVIFDMDGTMLDTEPISMNATMKAGEVLGVKFTQELCESFMGKSVVVIAEIIRKKFGADFNVEKVFELHGKFYDEYLTKHGVPAKPGIFEFLDKLESLGIKKCVATSTARERATRKLASIDLARRFEIIIGGDDVTNGKPAPDIFLKAAASCGFAPHECVVIEDTEAGILGATSAGIRTIVVPDVAPLNEKIRAKAFAVCTDLFEVAEMF
jgi:HAD superfamily hydrolase (TIGR01509 family)